MNKDFNARLQIGKQIAQLRKDCGYSQAKLAELTGMDPGNIARIELGKYSTGIDIISKIAKAFGSKFEFADLFVNSTQARELHYLGFDGDCDISYEEPEFLLQKYSKDWTPSPNIKIKFPTMNQALLWLTEKYGDKICIEEADRYNYTNSQKIDLILTILKS